MKKGIELCKYISVILYPADSPITSQQKQHNKVNHRLLPLMVLDSKILSKLLVNKIQPYIKIIIQYYQMGFISLMQGWFDF